MSRKDGKSIEEQLDDELETYRLNFSNSTVLNGNNIEKEPSEEEQEYQEEEDDGGEFAAYEPPDSLWQLIKSVAEPRELDLIRLKIGEALVETNLDLHNEIDTLLEIWRDQRNETNQTLAKLRSQHNLLHNEGGSGGLSSSSSLTTLEPLNVRRTLKREIAMFVMQMRSQYGQQDDAKFAKQIVTNNHNMNVISYVLNNTNGGGGSDEGEVFKLELGPKNGKVSGMGRSSSMGGGRITKVKRPSSTRDSHTGLETPRVSLRGASSKMTRIQQQSRLGGLDEGREGRQSRVRYRSTSATSSRSTSTTGGATTITNNNHNNFQASMGMGTMDENLEELLLEVDEEKINCMDVDDIAENLRDLFSKENATLESDIAFLYECIDAENDYRFDAKRGKGGIPKSNNDENDGSKNNNSAEPTLNELKEERKRLEDVLLSSQGRNQIKISQLPDRVTQANSNRSLMNSPVTTQRSQVSSAASTIQSSRKPSSSIANTSTTSRTRSKTPQKSSTTTTTPKPITQLNKASGGGFRQFEKKNVVTKRPSSIEKTKKVPTPSTSKLLTTTTRKPLVPVVVKSAKNASSMMSLQLGRESPSSNPHPLVPALSRASSVASDSASSTDLTASSSSRVSSAQKFRAMVFDQRD